ncbi:MAG: riboflavin synthase [Candidatus Omnitrophica bacterium]|nr:riboflavin synthase [Candidatus Omnitrophota bacterium]
MFTGIIRELGIVAQVGRAQGLVRVTIAAPTLASRLQLLDSVAVNGVCLSVVSVRHQGVIFEIIRETQRLTTLGTLRRGDQVHLEPSLTLSDRLNGHLLFGHVDGLGIVVKRRRLAGELILEIRVPAGFRTFVVPKGPVAIDGVSLTVGAALTRSTFTIHLIPETLRQTLLPMRRVGDRVNIELDYFAKLAHQFLLQRPPSTQPEQFNQ